MNGIAIAGNMLTDRVKMINDYPERQMLATILSVSRAVGGCVPNTAIDLSKIDPSLPLTALGRVGCDEDGRYVINELKNSGIDVSRIVISDKSSTSFSDVMNVKATGERTFFHYRGANAEFSPDDINVSDIGCKYLHIGYILLLDTFDRENKEYGTEMARFLHSAQEAGMNEIEGCGAAGVAPRDGNGALIKENVYRAMEKLMSYGVGQRVIIHCPEAGFILNKSGKFTTVPSLCLPDGFIKGSVGAGDAFCAGCLYGILEFASGAAACNLSAEDSVSGMKPAEEIEKMIKTMKRKDI